MKYLSYLLAISGIYFFVFACQPPPCTDDGCPEFNDLAYPPNEEFEETDDVVGSLIDSYYVVPVVATDNKDQFVYSLNQCITHLYRNLVIEKQIPRELIIAQAAIETGWGKSRFANEANNLFGIRTWNKDEKYLLPIPWTEWPGWGVKVFEHGEIPNGLDLAPTLTKYASRPNYTDLIATLIKYNIRGVYEL